MTYNKLFYSVAALGLALQICTLSPVAAMEPEESASSPSASPAKKPAPAETSEERVVEQIPHGAFLAPRRVGAGTSVVTSNLYTPEGTPIVERHNGQIPEHQRLIFGGHLKHTDGIVKSASPKSPEVPKAGLKKEKRKLKERKKTDATAKAEEMKEFLAEQARRRASSAAGSEPVVHKSAAADSSTDGTPAS